MKIGLLVTTYNRPQYLRQCFESIKRADLSQISTVWIVDDYSSDNQTLKLIQEFELSGIEVVKAFSRENRTVKGSLLFALEKMFDGCDMVINLDGDAIVKPNFVGALVDLKNKRPLSIVTGFNCTTRNRNGSIRHEIVEAYDDFNLKKSVGGINMLFDKSQYEKYVRPALAECLTYGGNWDHKTCIRLNLDGHLVACTVPSVVQHIGIESSMGHSAGGEPPDVADDFIDINDGLKFNSFHLDEAARFGGDKIILSNVTLIAVDCVSLERVFKAAEKCCEGIDFEDVKILSSIRPTKSVVHDIPHINNKEEYSWFMMKKLAPYVETSHMLVFQYDGYVLNPSAWDPSWLHYDYIGAPWEWYKDPHKVGNGGFSLRSKRLMDICATDDYLIPISDGLNTHKEEDHCIARIYRKYLENKYGIKFAPLEVARKFSIEGWRSDNRTWTNEFGFHGHGLTNVKP
jgi:glycosyltransferase involved in cell wall biosynthesis